MRAWGGGRGGHPGSGAVPVPGWGGRDRKLRRVPVWAGRGGRRREQGGGGRGRAAAERGEGPGGAGAAAAMKKQFNRMKQLANQTVGRWAPGGTGGLPGGGGRAGGLGSAGPGRAGPPRRGQRRVPAAAGPRRGAAGTGRAAEGPERGLAGRGGLGWGGTGVRTGPGAASRLGSLPAARAVRFLPALRDFRFLCSRCSRGCFDPRRGGRGGGRKYPRSRQSGCRQPRDGGAPGSLREQSRARARSR